MSSHIYKCGDDKCEVTFTNVMSSKCGVTRLEIIMLQIFELFYSLILWFCYYYSHYYSDKGDCFRWESSEGITVLVTGTDSDSDHSLAPELEQATLELEVDIDMMLTHAHQVFNHDNQRLATWHYLLDQNSWWCLVHVHYWLEGRAGPVHSSGRAARVWQSETSNLALLAWPKLLMVLSPRALLVGGQGRTGALIWACRASPITSIYACYYSRIMLYANAVLLFSKLFPHNYRKPRGDMYINVRSQV